MSQRQLLVRLIPIERIRLINVNGRYLDSRFSKATLPSESKRIHLLNRLNRASQIQTMQRGMSSLPWNDFTLLYFNIMIFELATRSEQVRLFTRVVIAVRLIKFDCREMYSRPVTLAESAGILNENLETLARGQPLSTALHFQCRHPPLP